jgi:hypothetical protein
MLKYSASCKFEEQAQKLATTTRCSTHICEMSCKWNIQITIPPSASFEQEKALNQKSALTWQIFLSMPDGASYICEKEING